MTTTPPPFPTGTILGYPRIGRRRELKRAVEAAWAGTISYEELERTAAELRRTTRERLATLGLGRDDSSIPESFSFYDQVLDAAVTVGAVPPRFADVVAPDGSIDLAGAFALARGREVDAPLEMTKWFDSNYHYLVPEISRDSVFRLASDRLVREFAEAREDGFVTRPVIVGPVTFLLLSKAAEGEAADFRPLDRLDDLLPVYAELLERLGGAGAQWVQLDEPGLVADGLAADSAIASAVARAYDVLGAVAGRPALFVTTPYGEPGASLAALAASPAEALHLDLVRGTIPSEFDAATRAGLGGKTLVAGVVDGHNVWRGDLGAAFDDAESLRRLSDRVAVSTSTSLLHVPHDTADEPELDGRLLSWLAFADQKVEQVAALARGLREGRPAIVSELDAASLALADRLAAPGVREDSVRTRQAALTAADRDRGSEEERVSQQTEALGLPVLPTTTIGSFPQTADIRRARSRHVHGDIDDDGYAALMRAEIDRVVALQEEIGLDVIVHGEPERNDMVQFFAENLDGFAVTINGWVQSYGSRCTRPSILWGDVSRPAPITVEWSTYAQSLTSKPVKGMLTGPVTILAWSFVRDDQPLGATADQVALALRDEIADLESAGIGVIQVDEPALRELLPLRERDRAAYLEWSVGAFRLATAGVAPRTQVHTHLCYSEFGTVIEAIRGLDADVTSIEAARSRMEIVDDIAASGFDHGIGPGVYDIHSPRVPSTEEVVELIDRALTAVPDRLLWINPDCGLKTRGYDETVASLRNVVDATRRVRARLAVPA